MRTAVFFLVILLGIPPFAHAEQGAVEPAAESLERYVGQYQIAPNRLITISRDGARLFAQNSGAPKVELLPRNRAEFAYANINVRLKFQGDAGGKARELVLSSGGVERLAKRLSTAEASRIEMLSQTEVAVDPKVLDEYVGYFEVKEPTYLLFRLTREDDDLFAQIIGQPKVQIFARSTREFFYRIVPGHIVFAAPEGVRSPGFILSLSGVDYAATRLDNRQGEQKAAELRTAAAAPPPPRQAAAVATEQLARHVGTYQLQGLDMMVTISLDGAQLYSQTTLNGKSMPRQALLAETDAKFYMKDAPLRFTFEPGSRASAKLLIDSGGQQSVAVRSE
ncbi:MAG TPA: hypothetical protein VFS58_03885 [Steroidobacteraceae bacterium]|nr:hypothetical protein [Steroidobacteraceae bacterium]